jgi:hypothetical protein
VLLGGECSTEISGPSSDICERARAVASAGPRLESRRVLARLVGPVPSVDHAVELQDLRLEHSQLSAERGEARAGDFRHPFVFWIGTTTRRRSSTPLRPTGATIPNSARCARIALIVDVAFQAVDQFAYAPVRLRRSVPWSYN